MANIRFLDRLNEIQLTRPPSMSDAEFAEIQTTLDEAIDRVRPYRGALEADWLISDFQSDLWQTKGLDTAFVDGTWVRAKNIDWSVQLSNGDMLTDPGYSELLHAIKAAAFLYREGFAGGVSPTVGSWLSFVHCLLDFARWLVFSDLVRGGVVLLSQSRLDQLAVELAAGGWSGAFRLSERIVAAFHKETFDQDCPQSILEDPGRVPLNVRDSIIEHLEACSAYTMKGKRRRALSRDYICRLISEPKWSMYRVSNRTRAVIRQFEPSMHNKNGLLIPSDAQKRYPSHRTITIEAALAQRTTIHSAKRLCGSMKILLSMHRHLPGGVLDPSTVNATRSFRLARPHAGRSGHSPLIPIEIGLQYLNQAMKWVNQFGDGLVEYYLAVTTEVIARVRSNNLSPYETQVAGLRALQKVTMPASLSDAGFGLAIRHEPRGKMGMVTEIRNMDITQAIRVWIGAVAVVIGMFKPSRDSEISRLERDCLIGDGPYWLDGEIAKTGTKEERDTSGGKPIPTIAAKGIQQMQLLGETLRTLYDEKDPVHAERLFYIPKKGLGVGAIAAMPSSLHRYLDAFCDFVDMPRDELGRRWSLRIHEMRRWFLLLFFWSGRYDVLDAARDIAGHSDIAELYAYVEREFSSEDFFRLEAEYCIDRLRDFDYTKDSDPEERGLAELYNAVLEEFDVAQLELIPDRAWEAYVTALRQQDKFYLEPHSIADRNGNSRICISFRSRPDCGLTL